MPTWTYTPIADGTLADVPDLNTPFAALQAIINALDSSNLAADCVGASEHADISTDTTNPYHAGAGIVMPAAGFGSTNLSTQMGLVSAALGMSAGAATGLKYLGFTSHATDPTSALAIVVNSGPSTLLIVAGVTQNLVSAAGTLKNALDMVQYTIAGAGAVNAVPLNCSIEGVAGIGVVSTSCGMAKITADPTKTTTINFIASVVTAGGTYTPTSYWCAVFGF